MPLYEYECDACGQRFEVIQKFSDPAPDACRKCGKGPVHRLASSPAIQFKGTGWYVTDYANKGKDTSTVPAGKSSEGSKSDGASGSSSEGAGKSDGATGKSESKGESSKSEGAQSAKGDSGKSESPKSDSASSAKPSASGGSKE